MDIPRNLLLQSHARWTTSLIGKLVSDQEQNPNEVLHAIRSKWKLKKKLDIVVVNGNLFILRFEKENDKNKILNAQPWQMLGYLLVLKSYSPELAPSDINFDQAPFWITFGGLHLEHQMPVFIEQISSTVGRFLEIYPADDSPRDAEGYRARVMVDLRNPLRQGHLVPTVNHGSVWITFNYVGIPFRNCKNCFRLGHDTYSCSMVPPPRLNNVLAVPPPEQEIMLLDGHSTPAEIKVPHIQYQKKNNEEDRNHHLALFGGEAIVVPAITTDATEITRVLRGSSSSDGCTYYDPNKENKTRLTLGSALPYGPEPIGPILGTCSNQAIHQQIISIFGPDPTNSSPININITNQSTHNHHISFTDLTLPPPPKTADITLPPPPIYPNIISKSRRQNKGKCIFIEPKDKPLKKRKIATPKKIEKESANQKNKKLKSSTEDSPYIPSSLVTEASIEVRSDAQSTNPSLPPLRISDFPIEHIWELITNPEVNRLLLSQGVVLHSLWGGEKWNNEQENSDVMRNEETMVDANQIHPQMQPPPSIFDFEILEEATLNPSYPVETSNSGSLSLGIDMPGSYDQLQEVVTASFLHEQFSSISKLVGMYICMISVIIISVGFYLIGG
ncbi:hypothetical protein IFM89_035518 [Coptis chinensis]|uniref:DUF4283 domain-containing protein n=1 Tax=Coptis chinensis TaxID=261450 RepID=A0A835HB60_9MAGN|nr:hypothetical protein IFM89_035518 [Coptis chinensis]